MNLNRTLTEADTVIRALRFYATAVMRGEEESDLTHTEIEALAARLGKTE
jgi:hypothetical protein